MIKTMQIFQIQSVFFNFFARSFFPTISPRQPRGSHPRARGLSAWNSPFSSKEPFRLNIVQPVVQMNNWNDLERTPTEKKTCSP
jgi:hypothetical protein